MYFRSDFELIIYTLSSCLAHAQCATIRMNLPTYIMRRNINYGMMWHNPNFQSTLAERETTKNCDGFIAGINTEGFSTSVPMEIG